MRILTLFDWTFRVDKLWRVPCKCNQAQKLQSDGKFCCLELFCLKTFHWKTYPRNRRLLLRSLQWKKLAISIQRAFDVTYSRWNIYRPLLLLADSTLYRPPFVSWKHSRHRFWSILIYCSIRFDWKRIQQRTEIYFPFNIFSKFLIKLLTLSASISLLIMELFKLKSFSHWSTIESANRSGNRQHLSASTVDWFGVSHAVGTMAFNNWIFDVVVICEAIPDAAKSKIDPHNAHIVVRISNINKNLVLLYKSLSKLKVDLKLI